MPAIHIPRGRPSRAVQALIVAALLVLSIGVAFRRDLASPAEAATSISQIHYTPFEAQVFIDVLRSINGNPACCSGPVHSAVSITSGADANTVVYDHFEDGYEIDPFDPQQASTVTLIMDQGQVWTQSSSVPVDPRGTGTYYDGRDKVVSTAPIAMTQTGYADVPGTLHAGGVQVMDRDKSGTSFQIPIGQDADYNQVFEYVGLIVVGTEAGTTVDVDADADGVSETTLILGAGEVGVVDGGVNLGATVTADAPVATYLASGDVAATYEGRFIELYPTHAWSNAYISPVGARGSGDDGTRVFLFNPGATAIDVDVTEGGGGTATVTVPAGGQSSHLMPVDAGARFASADGSPFYALQAVTTEGASTSAYDWGFTLIPEIASTPVVVVPYGPGSAGNTNNYSPLWVAPSADTTLYVDLDGDPTTGSFTDPAGNLYDFTCAATALQSLTIYDDGSANCYSPSQNAAAGGDRDMTGARVYSVDGTRVSSAWGQRSSYVAGSPALDMGTTILPYPALLITKTAAISGDVDGDGQADPGDTITYTVALQNDGIVDVTDVVIADEVPANTTYVTGSTTLDGAPQSDDTPPFSPFPVDADSPAGEFVVGTVLAGATVQLSYSMLIDNPTPFGVISITNEASISSEYGDSTTIQVVRLDLIPLQISKTSTPSSNPLGAGDTIDYTIRVFNGDTVAHTGVDLSDALPAGTTYVAGSVSADVDGTPVAAAAPPDLVTGLTLNEGEVLTVAFRAGVDSPLPSGITEFTNTASVTSDQSPDPVEGTVADPGGAAADLSLAKTDGDPGVLQPGDPITYTLTVTNSGPDYAADVTLVDALPAGVTLDPAGTDPSCVESLPGTLTCSLGDLEPGSVDVAIAVTIDAGTDGTVTNQATTSSPTPDPYPGDESAFVGTVVDAPPAVTVTKTAVPNSLVEPGGTVTFTVEVANPTLEMLTLTGLLDDGFGDLLDVDNVLVTANTCPSAGRDIPVGGVFSCTFEVEFVGSAGDPVHTDVVTATVLDDEGNPAADDDAATVSFTDAIPTVDITKTPWVAALDEPGGLVTFDVVVENTSSESVTLTDLTDDVFGDLLVGANPLVSSNTCTAAASASIDPGGMLSCSFEAMVTGDASGPDHADVITVTVIDDELNPASAAAGATVTFNDVAPAITITKTPTPASLPEPGGSVTFDVVITNDTGEQITLITLDDTVFGDLLDDSNPGVASNDCPDQPLVIPGGGTLACSFEATVDGDPADPAHTNTVTATATDNESNPATDAASASVAITDVAPSVSVDKSASPSEVPEPGVPVTFTVVVTNTADEDVTLQSLTDDVFGDLLDVDNDAVSTNTCPSASVTISAGSSITCSFSAEVTGSADGDDHTDTVTATVVDDEGTTATGSDGATVGFSDADSILSGHVFVDVDGDGIQDATEGDLAGIGITIVDGEGNTITVITDAYGDWTASVEPGSATMSVQSATVPAGYQLTTAKAQQAIGVPIGTSVQSDDVGYRSAPSSIAGTAFLDLDGNHVLGIGDVPLGGIRVVAFDEDGIEVGDDLTDANGDYLIDDVGAGSITVRLDPATLPAGLAAAWDLDGIADRTTVVTVADREAVADVDFAERGTGVIGDLAWIDADGNGTHDQGETLLEGVSVALTWAGLDGEFGTSDDVDFGERVSDADGFYRFVGLPPGDYLIEADASTAGLGMAATTELEVEITLEPGTEALFADFGFRVSQQHLPVTGFDPWRMLWGAIALIGSGLGLLGGSFLWERRRRPVSARRSIHRSWA